MNTPINFEIGKLLKDNKQNISSSKLMYASNGKLTDAIYDFDEWCFAPTITETVMWFYEKHDIWISVYLGGLNFFYFEVRKLDNLNAILYSSEMEALQEKRIYDTPTEAYSEAIKYILINNIIKK